MYVRHISNLNNPTFVWEGDEHPLSTRLGQGPARANHKRALSDHHPVLNQFHHFVLSTNNEDRAAADTIKSPSRGDTFEACAQGDYLRDNGEQWFSTVEYEAGDMSRRSSEKYRDNRSSSQAVEIPSAEQTGVLERHGPVEDEVKEIVDDQPLVTSIRRLTRSERHNLSEKEARPAKLAVNLKPAAPNSNGAPIAKQSSWGKIYWDRSKNSLPDYGPTVPVRVVTKEGQDMVIDAAHFLDIIVNVHQRLKPENGVRPINTLGSLPPVKPQNSSKQATNKSNSVTATNGHREDENSRKRQRAEGFGKGSSSNAPIELDDSPYSQLNRTPSSVRSGQSRDGNSLARLASLQKEGGVSEYRQVEKTIKLVKPRSRNGHPSENASTINRGPERFRMDSVMEARRKNSKDSISDDELDILPSYKKLTVQDKIQPRTEHQDKFHLAPSRQDGSEVQKSHSTRRRDTDAVSKHFPRVHSRVGHASASVGGHQTATNPSRARQHLSKQDNNNSEIDELASDPHFGKAKALLLDHKLERSLLAKPNRKQKLSSEVCSSSDEYTPAKSGDIEPTTFSSTRGKSKDHGVQVYEISQVFAPGHNWLIPARHEKWLLHQNCEAGVITILNENGTDPVVMSMNIRSIHRLEWSRKSSKLGIFKTQDQSTRGASNIYIEFQDCDETAAFVEYTRSYDTNIVSSLKSSDHLDRVFATTQSKSKFKKQKLEKVEDLQLLESKSDARQALHAKQRRPNGSRVPAKRLIDEFNENPDQPEEKVGYRSSGRTRASFDVAEEGLQQRGIHEGTQTGLYSNSDHTDTRQPLPLGTRSSQRMIGNSLPSPRIAPRQSQRQRISSPSPVRWTENNPGWQENYWHGNTSVIYPREGKNKASVDRQDIERLDEGEFLNDNLIIFYLRWLEHRLAEERPDLVDRIYFHNTFFYERLTKPGKGKVDGINYDAVARWTAKVDLLNYDYIVVPVNETVHWYVAIICNAPKLLEKGIGLAKSSLPAKTEGCSNNEQSGVESRGISALHQIVEPSPACGISEAIDAEMRDVTLVDKGTEPPAVENGHVQSLASPSEVTVASEATQVDLGEISPANIVSDLITDAATTKANNIKKAKRKSILALRKYDPEEPRIITLDSLGITHSPTCTNLKKYLMQETMAKKGFEIDDPGSLGFTAKCIPQQDNHCDCGLFLLIYIEQFLKRPDEFVRNILQRDPVRNHASIDIGLTENWSEWPRASKMRDDIRDLLFKLHREQSEEAEAAKKQKITAKAKVARAEGDTGYLSTSKAAYREGSKSARASPVKGQIPLENIEQPGPENTRKPTPPDAHEVSRVDTRKMPGSPNLRAAEARLEGVRNSQSAPDKPGLLTTLFSKVTSSILNVARPDQNDNVVTGFDHRQSSPEYVTIPDDPQDNGDGKTKAHDLSSHARSLEFQTAKDRTARSQGFGRFENPQVNDSVEILDSQVPYRVLHHPLPNSSSFRSPTPEQETPAFNFAEKFAENSDEESAGSQSASKEHRENPEAGWSGNYDTVIAEEDVVDLVDTTPSKPINVVALDDAADDQNMLLASSAPPDATYLSSSPSYASSLQPKNTVERRRENQKSQQSSPMSVKKLQRRGFHTELQANKKRKRFEPLDEGSRKTRKQESYVLDPSDKKMVEQ
ncbi:unnamed protein product [Diplocarpon coronariae]